MKLYKEKNDYHILALITGVLGMFLWIIPMASIIVNFVCIILSSIGLDVNGNRISVASLVLGIVGLILTFLRSGLVNYLL